MSSLNLAGTIDGASGALIVFLSLITGLYLILAYRRSKSKQTLALGFFLGIVCFSWFGVTINFFLVLTGNSVLPDMTYMLVIAWAIVFALVPLTYVIFSMLKTELVSYAVAISILIAIIYVLLMYVLVPFGVIPLTDVFKVSYDPNSQLLPDSTYIGLSQLFVSIIIVLGLISGIFFVVTGLRTNIKYVKVRSIIFGIGFIIYISMATIDGLVVGPPLLVLLFVRIFLAIAVILNAIGITMPTFITKPLNIEKPTV